MKKTTFIKQIKEFVVKKYKTDAVIQDEGNVILLNFCCLHCDYRRNLVKIEINYNQNYSEELYYLVHFLLKNGIKHKLISKGTFERKKYIQELLAYVEMDDEDNEFRVEKNDTEQTVIANEYIEFSIN